MSNDADSCVPTQVKDFIFDLSDSVTLSQISEEQSKLYTSTFRELCNAYFTSSPWPSPQSIAPECNGHPLFLAIYREVTHRHSFGTSRPTVRDRLEGWNVYRELFDELLDEENISSSQSPFYLLPDWTFDILHEFVYQFQGFCQFRAAVYGSAKKHNIDVSTLMDKDSGAETTSAPHHLMENLTHLAQNKEAWAVESVYFYLTKLIAVGKKCTVPAYQYFGIFSSIALSRLECLLGDFHACLEAAQPVVDNTLLSGQVVTVNGVSSTSLQVSQSVVGARLSYAYHAGVALLMTRQYKPAQRVLGEACAYLIRGFKTGQLLRNKADQCQKTLDRMICLLSISAHICPPTGIVEDVVLRMMRDKYGSQLVQIDNSGSTQGYIDMFSFGAPKFVSPHLQNYQCITVRQFGREMASLTRERKLRSYMKLYTSIEIEKLAKFNNVTPEEFLSILLSFKNKMRDNNKSQSSSDIHYHLNGDLVLVNEAEKQRRFENFFMKQIAQNAEIFKSVSNISTKV